MESGPKKACVPKTIGTHNGTFHCDEALACYMLKLLPEYSDARITRTRDPELLKDCDLVVDVGGVYDPSTHRYDHHQRCAKWILSCMYQIVFNISQGLFVTADEGC